MVFYNKNQINIQLILQTALNITLNFAYDIEKPTKFPKKCTILPCAKQDARLSSNKFKSVLIVVFPCMLIITQLLFQQNALVY
jgi:hypothetical protein